MKNDKIIKLISLIAIIFFTILGISSIIAKDMEFLFDRFFTAAILLFGLFFYKKMHLKLPVIIMGLFALILHHLKLYGNVYFGIPFDRIMHFIAGFALALIFYQYLAYYTNKKGLTKTKTIIVAVFVAVGVASSMEILEFIGYHYLGYGEGLLFYGTGDFGEYNNICWDLICNTLGALFAVITMAFMKNHKGGKNI